MHQAVPGAVVRRAQDAVHDRVAQVQVGRGHVDLGPQRARPVGELARAHAPEEVQALLRRAPAEGAVAARLGQRAAVLARLLGREVVDVGQARADQVLGPGVEGLEVVRGEVQVGPPVEAEPAHVLLDRLDVLGLLRGRVGVVEAQVAAPAELRGDAEVEADRLGVPDVQVAVGLGREARDHLLPRRAVALDALAHEVQALALERLPVVGGCHAARRSLVPATAREHRRRRCLGRKHAQG